MIITHITPLEPGGKPETQNLIDDQLRGANITSRTADGGVKVVFSRHAEIGNDTFTTIITLDREDIEFLRELTEGV